MRLLYVTSGKMKHRQLLAVVVGFFLLLQGKKRNKIKKNNVLFFMYAILLAPSINCFEMTTSGVG